MKYKEELKKTGGQYATTVYKIANNAFENEIKPFCIKRGYTFYSGMGSYALLNEKGKILYMEGIKKDTELLSIFHILDEPIDYWPDNCLGSIMPDFTDRVLK